MKLTKKQLAQMIENARAEKACEKTLQYISALSPKEVLSNSNASLWACWYARYVIKGRWLEVEAIISKNAELASWYDFYVIKDR